METSSRINLPFCLQHSITCPVVDSQDFSFFMCYLWKSVNSDLYFQMELHL